MIREMMEKPQESNSEVNFENGHTSRPNSSEIFEFDVEEFYNNLINEAPYIPGDKRKLIPAKDIPWINKKLLDEGLTFGRRNIFSIAFANTAALMYGFSVKPDSVVLLRSGKFHRAELAFRRYLSTARKIASWYIYGIMNADSEGYKNIKIVRSLHSYYAKCKDPLPLPEDMEWTPDKNEIVQAIRDDLDFLDTSDAPTHLLTWRPPLPFSQFDMAMTQFGFVGLIYLHSSSIGISDRSKMNGFLHFWAVIGRMLGLEDRFNLALHADQKLFRKIYVNVGLASLKSTDETVICLQNSLIKGLSKRLPFLTLKSWIFYGLSEEVDGFKGDHLWKIMTFYDKFCFKFLKGSLKMIHNSAFIRVIVNIWTVVILQLAYWIYLPTGGSCPNK